MMSLSCFARVRLFTGTRSGAVTAARTVWPLVLRSAFCVPRFSVALIATALFFGPHVFAQGADVFATPLTSQALESAAFVQWVDGTESAPPDAKRGPAHVIWTRESQPEWNGLTYGDSKTMGPRHLRVGWKAPLPTGSVLVRGGGAVSVLKSSAKYPGKLDREDDWIPAQRLRQGQPSGEEAGEEEYAIWVLPPGTSTRAIRFTHVSRATDKTYGGWLGGAYLLAGRFANVAPLAGASANANQEKQNLLNNELNDRLWSTWDNAPGEGSRAVSPQNPAWITLVWPQAVKVRGLNALWAGFKSADVHALNSAEAGDPADASDSSWQQVASTTQVTHQYPRALSPNWIDFGRDVTTRALRLRITGTFDEKGAHEHLRGKTRAGMRVWLAELMALQPLETSELAKSVAASSSPALQPPIPIKFTLPEEGLVTLVIEDPQGKRVRNLVSETKYPAGENIAWWDGTDDLLRDPESAKHGLYHIPAQFVAPGDYKVRGLWRKPLELKYEFSIYNAGMPAWETADKTGAWLANHTPPASALFVPAARAGTGKDLIYLGSFVSEGGHGLAWVDLEGRKQGGMKWVGGTWTGAAFLARDDGPQPAPGVVAYVAAPWSVETYLDKAKDKRGEIRLTAITTNGTRPVFKHVFLPSFATNTAKGADQDWFGELGGLAAHNGVLVFSLPRLNQVVLVNTRAGDQLTTMAVQQPHGVAFDAQGRLLVVSDTQVLRFNFDAARPDTSARPSLAIGTGLQAPRQITLDATGQMYISDHGTSHQVKLFSADGRLIRSIGKAGTPKAGPYDPQHMNHPLGLTVDSRGRLWVAENDFQPKRVSVWTSEGQLVRAFYGPSEYGGGGKLDPQDKTKFYYHGMEFRLDWDRGTDELVSVFHRPGPNDLKGPEGWGSTGNPEQPYYVNGRRYFGNSHNSNPTGGPGTAMLWVDDNGIARPVAALGRAQDWKVLKSEPFRKAWPQGANAAGDLGRNAAFFVWSDLNGDVQVQPEEVVMRTAVSGAVTIAADLAFIVSRVGSEAMRFAPTRFTARHAPVYDINRGEVLAKQTQGPSSSGGDQALWHPSGWTVLTTPPKPFSPMSVGAVFKTEPRWSYPSLWPGLHASHESPPPDRPGQIIGTTRLLGDFVTPARGDAGPIWGVNGNQGNMYLFTADGLFVAELFHDVRRAPTWSMPAAQRGMLLNGLTLHDENFWPSMTQAKDGNVYLCDGARTSLVRVDGLDSIRRFPEIGITISPAELARAREYFTEAELRRQSTQRRGALKVQLRREKPRVDGDLGDWTGAEWVDVDKSGVAAFFDSNSKPYDVRAAMAVSGDRLYVAFRSNEKDLLRNSGEMRQALFKTGGALDLMIGADPRADEKRGRPVPGDQRLVVTMVQGRPAATLYRAVVPGTRDPVPFSSPSRTLTVDRVDDVSRQVDVAAKEGAYEFSVPLSVLGLKPQSGLRLKGDVGVLRGNGFETVQRVYWHNKASGITADVPSEAELTPRLWGRLEFVEQ